jgi:hypothetical protein
VRFYFIAGNVVVAIALLVFTHWRAYDYGRLGEREQVRQALAKHDEREARLIEELESERKKVRVEYRERIKIVQKAADPVACIDERLPAALLKSFHRDAP